MKSLYAVLLMLGMITGCWKTKLPVGQIDPAPNTRWDLTAPPLILKANVATVPTTKYVYSCPPDYRLAVRGKRDENREFGIPEGLEYRFQNNLPPLDEPSDDLFCLMFKTQAQKEWEEEAK